LSFEDLIVDWSLAINFAIDSAICDPLSNHQSVDHQSAFGNASIGNRLTAVGIP